MTHLRTTAFTLYFVIGTGVASLIALPVILFGERATRLAVRLWAHAMLGGLRVLCGVSYRVEGREFVPRGGAVVAANHQSMWETIALFAILERPVVVLKEELLKIPVYGWWAKRTGNIPIDRAAGARAARALMRAARAQVEEGRQIVVFPEGTRVPFGDRAPLQPGVAGVYAASGAPCTVAVHDSGARWLHPGHFTSRKVPGVITIRFFPPIEPGLDRKAFMRALETTFAEGVNPSRTGDAKSGESLREGAAA